MCLAIPAKVVELLDDADPAARTEANRMLRDLG